MPDQDGQEHQNQLLLANRKIRRNKSRIFYREVLAFVLTIHIYIGLKETKAEPKTLSFKHKDTAKHLLKY